MVNAGLWTIALASFSGNHHLKFISKRGSHLYEGNDRFRFVGLVVPNLLCLPPSATELQAEKETLEEMCRFPDAFEQEDAVQTAVGMGASVVQTGPLLVGSHYIQDLNGNSRLNEAAFQVVDRAISLCANYGIRLVVPLASGSCLPGNSSSRTCMGKVQEKQAISLVLHRRNTVTGRVYKDDPAILGWHLSHSSTDDDGYEETNRSSDKMLQSMASLVKSIDRYHLVLSGQIARSPFVDVAVISYSSQDKEDIDRISSDFQAIDALQKPFVFQLQGHLDVEFYQNGLRNLFYLGNSGALVDGVVPHSRHGGFLSHHNGTLRIPGEKSIQSSDERDIVELIQRFAFSIKGKSIPSIKPAVPRIWSTEKPGEIRWRGVAWAYSYSVIRSTQERSNWMVYERRLTDFGDAIWKDTGRVPGKVYCYAMRAHGLALVSECSNILCI